MLNHVLKSFASGLACLGLAACVTQREFVVAPETTGVVIAAETGLPVEGARVRFAGDGETLAAVTGQDGRFALPGLTEKRTIVAVPVGGIFRDSAAVTASAPGAAEAFASAAFIQGGLPARALYTVTVILFPAGSPQTPLQQLVSDCTGTSQHAHALQIVELVSGVDPASPPAWLDQEAVEALQEHLRLTLPSSLFQSCTRGNEAYALFKTQTEPLEALARAAYLESLPPSLRPPVETGGR